jgi:hypothetical protein
VLPTQKLRLLRDGVLIDAHVYSAGDVVEVDGDRAKDMVKYGAGAVVDAGTPVTPPPVGKERSEVIAQNTAAAAEAAKHAHAEKAEKRPKY